MYNPNEVIFNKVIQYLMEDHPKILEKDCKYISFYLNQESRNIDVEIESGFVYTTAGKNMMRRLRINRTTQTEDIKLLALTYYHKHLKA